MNEFYDTPFFKTVFTFVQTPSRQCEGNKFTALGIHFSSSKVQDAGVWGAGTLLLKFGGHVGDCTAFSK